MAKLSKSGTTILWRMEKTIPDEGGSSGTRRYALRSDGVLLSNYIADLHDGRHNYGWKVAARKPFPDIRERLIARGYR